MPSLLAGYLIIAAAIFFNGSFLVPFKVEQVQQVDIHPLIFQFYTSIGVLLLSIVVILLLPYNAVWVEGGGDQLKFLPLGALAGAILEVTLWLNFISTQKIGIALSTGIVGGVTELHD